LPSLNFHAAASSTSAAREKLTSQLYSRKHLPRKEECCLLNPQQFTGPLIVEEIYWPKTPSLRMVTLTTVVTFQLNGQLINLVRSQNFFFLYGTLTNASGG
jgi:hypothetical protein